MKEEPLLGKKPRREPMFYYVRMEEIVPENYLLRLTDKHIDLGFIRDKVKRTLRVSRLGCQVYTFHLYNNYLDAFTYHLVNSVDLTHYLAVYVLLSPAQQNRCCCSDAVQQCLPLSHAGQAPFLPQPLRSAFSIPLELMIFVRALCPPKYHD